MDFGKRDEGDDICALRSNQPSRGFHLGFWIHLDARVDKSSGRYLPTQISYYLLTAEIECQPQKEKAGMIIAIVIDIHFPIGQAAY